MQLTRFSSFYVIYVRYKLYYQCGTVISVHMCLKCYIHSNIAISILGRVHWLCWCMGQSLSGKCSLYTWLLQFIRTSMQIVYFFEYCVEMSKQKTSCHGIYRVVPMHGRHVLVYICAISNVWVELQCT